MEGFRGGEINLPLWPKARYDRSPDILIGRALAGGDGWLAAPGAAGSGGVLGGRGLPGSWRAAGGGPRGASAATATAMGGEDGDT